MKLTYDGQAVTGTATKIDPWRDGARTPFLPTFLSTQSISESTGRRW
jgi:hypothetical protein